MEHLQPIERIVHNRRYSTANATLLAGNDVTGNDTGITTFLYVTAKGNYFEVNWWESGEQETTLNQLTPDEAQQLYEGPLTNRRIDHTTAFPTAIQDA